MSERLPENLASLASEELSEAKKERDRRLTPLFRRWPALNKLEIAELHRVWDERVRLAKHSGARRRQLAANNGRSL